MTHDMPPSGRGDRSSDARTPRSNLTALDPRADAEAFEAAVRSITADAMAERARVRAARLAGGPLAPWGALAGVAAWRRAALVAACLVALISLPTLLVVHEPPPAAPTTLAEAAGIPRPLVMWIHTNHSPSAAELVATLGADGRAATRTTTRGRTP